MHHRTASPRRSRTLAATLALAAFVPGGASALSFTAGDLVISVYGNGDGSGTYLDNGASPITLQQFTTAGLAAGQITLPQSVTSANGRTQFAISGEYGSSSEGTLQLSGDGQSLVIAGYGVNAATFNSSAQSYGGGTKSCIGQGTCYPLAQTSSVPGYAGSTGSGVTTAVTVPRVVALVGANGSVDTSTALTGVYNENNPRSVATVNGTSFYLSGQGFNKTDTTTQGLFYAQLGATVATKIDTTFDTRTVSIQNGQLFLSADSTEGSGVHENISSYGTPGTLPTTTATATVLPGLKSKYATTSSAQLNTLDTALGGSSIYLSPENYFFANATTLYVADSGAPKGDNNGTSGAPQGLGDGGLQKWSLVAGTWMLDYTLSNGLQNFVSDTTPCGANQVGCGTTGLYGLTGVVNGGIVSLYATNYTLGDQDQTYLYSITDSLASTTSQGQAFQVLTTAAPDTAIRGVAFAPTALAVPEPASAALLGSAVLAALVRRRRLSQKRP